MLTIGKADTYLEERIELRKQLIFMVESCLCVELEAAIRREHHDRRGAKRILCRE